MKNLIIGLAVAASLGAFSSGSAAEPVSACKVSVIQEPLVMRLNKDEFRIAFGVGGDRCADEGCSGVIRYQTTWKTEDGATGTESKLVSYAVPRGASRTVAVDRHYFDTAEGQHTTDIVKVSVDEVGCSDSVAMR